jgi:hypothetical protein
MAADTRRLTRSSAGNWELMYEFIRAVRAARDLDESGEDMLEEMRLRTSSQAALLLAVGRPGNDIFAMRGRGNSPNNRVEIDQCAIVAYFCLLGGAGGGGWGGGGGGCFAKEAKTSLANSVEYDPKGPKQICA